MLDEELKEIPEKKTEDKQVADNMMDELEALLNPRNLSEKAETSKM